MTSSISICLVLLAIVCFWIVQIVDLMSMRDDAFPGRHDKLIWVGIVVLLPLAGALAYAVWKTKLDPDSQPTPTPENLRSEWDRMQAARKQTGSSPEVT